MDRKERREKLIQIAGKALDEARAEAQKREEILAERRRKRDECSPEEMQRRIEEGRLITDAHRKMHYKNYQSGDPNPGPLSLDNCTPYAIVHDIEMAFDDGYCGGNWKIYLRQEVYDFLKNENPTYHFGKPLVQEKDENEYILTIPQGIRIAGIDNTLPRGYNEDYGNLGWKLVPDDAPSNNPSEP